MNITYSGITLEQSLSEHVIANKVISKYTKKVKFIYTHAKQFDLKTKKLLVSALIQCYFDYACTSWYTGLTKKNKVQVASGTKYGHQVYVKSTPPPRTHIRSEEFQSVCLLPVEHIVDQLNNMHKIFHDKAPEYMKCEFQLSSNGHGARYTVVSQYSLSQEQRVLVKIVLNSLVPSYRIFSHCMLRI